MNSALWAFCNHKLDRRNEIPEIEEVNKLPLTMPIVGKEAPDFVLPGYYHENEVRVRFSDFRGKWIILFFYLSDFSTI
ncbi:hypothetical protein BM613_04095 [Sulfoacidibacillus thermotolerans]|uniref:Alkyl hydroperoxide reductase subunit C/ Thiol specific antioxidant domain-containing protein n=1 Tax=Sulfoacidibacillus thermotolerans TaxID=1765684 RepID=A0A2U3DAZ0_SULT2|nr:hypothetical protein BM613_04095 [Sulfoacidibacillus thermotolerans]